MTERPVPERLTHYSFEVDAGIGLLMPQLDPAFSSEPQEARLKEIISSYDRAQLISRVGARVIGAATMNTVMGYGKGQEGWLEDFVVDRAYRGSGAADGLWQEMINWCREQSLPSFSFETEAYRTAAIAFYRRKGAELVPGTTTHYRVIV